MEELINALKAKQWTIASCESLTGGLFASQMVAIEGASSVFRGALVTYATDMKEKLAHVDASLIGAHGVVSAQVARAMAVNTRLLLGSDVAVSFTGNAGPLPMEGKPVGLVYSAIALAGSCEVFEDTLSGSREQIRNDCIRLMQVRLLNLLGCC